MKIYIDLDRTLLDTSAFTQKLWGFLAMQDGALDAQIELARAKDFFDYRGDMYAYDFFEHARQALKCGEVQLQTILAVISKKLRQETVLYPETATALEMFSNAGEVRILTYGKADYQRFKLQCCALLDALPATIVEQPKGTFFEVLETTEPCVLIDDKPTAADLPPFVRFILVNRTQSDEVRQQSGFVSANSLETAAKVVNNLAESYNVGNT